MYSLAVGLGTGARSAGIGTVLPGKAEHDPQEQAPDEVYAALERFFST